jgi:hypothetical protein
MESSTVFGGKKEESSLADKTQEICVVKELD